MTQEREQRQWWVVKELGAGYTVQEVTGYRCQPVSSGYWWCPEVGFSMQEGAHLFESEDKALEKALGLVNGAIQELRQQSDHLFGRLHR